MTRHHTFRMLLACGAALATAGCEDDFLDVVSPTTISDDIFWSQESDAVLSLNGVYSQLPSAITIVELDGLTDNGTVNRQFDGRYVYSDGSFSTTGGYSRDRWIDAYTGIARANVLLANIDRIPEARIDATRKLRYAAEARFLRAYFYNNLVNLFGDVPLVLEPLDIAAAKAVSRTPAAEVVDQIFADLDAAAAVLPTTYAAADAGRATRGAALALKARAALFAGRYQVAADAAKAVMDLGIYSLHSSYSALFTYAGETSPEIIFARNYSKTAQASGQNSGVFQEFGPASNSAFGRIVPIRSLIDSYQATDGQPISGANASPIYDPAPDQMYNNRDPRLAATLLFPGASWDGRIYDSRPRPISTTPDAISPQDEVTPVTGYNIRKYIDLTDKADRNNGGINTILIRYADVLLMYAEARIELGQIDGTVLAAIDQVRQRPTVNMPPVPLGSQAEMRDAVRYERRAELAFEGLRLFDMRRWRIAEAVMPTAAVVGIDYLDGGVIKTVLVPASARSFPVRNYLWPIPQTEIDINPNLAQNPGY